MASSSLISSAYFATRPVLGSNALKVMNRVTENVLSQHSIDSSDAGATKQKLSEALASSNGEEAACVKLALAEHIAHSSKVEKDLEQALAYVEEAQPSTNRAKATAQLVLANIYFKRGSAQDAHEAANAAQALLSDHKDKSELAKAFHAKALAHFMTDDISAAVRSAQKALALHKDSGDDKSCVFEMLVIAQWQLSSSKPYASLTTAKQARAMAHGMGNLASEAAAVLLMCESLVQSGQRAKAVRMAKDALAEFKSGGDQIGIALGHCIVVFALISSENPIDALDAAQDGTRYVQTLNNNRLELDFRYMKCQAHLKSNEEEEAAKTMRSGAALARQLDDAVGEADSLRMVSFALSNVEDLTNEPVLLSEAIEAAEEARTLYKTAGFVGGEASALLLAVVLNSQKEETELDLVSMVKEARELYSDAQDALGEHAALTLLADLHVRASAFSDALEFANASVELWTNFGSRKAQADAMQAVANINVMMEDFEEAESRIIEAQQLARDVGAKRLEASLSILLTKVYLEEGAADKDQEAELRLAAMTASEKALAVGAQSGEKDLWAIALIWRSQVLSWGGRAGEALKLAEKSEKAFGDLKDLRNQCSAMIKQSELLRQMDKKPDARDVANKALNFATLNTECAGLEKDAQAVLNSMQERRPQVQRSGGGGRMGRRMVKKWRKKEGGGGGGVVAKKGLDPKSTQDKIMTLVQNVLADEDELGADVPFMEAGVDSLGSVQLVTDVGKAFQMPLAPSIVFDYPTVRVLAEHLVEESGAASADAPAGGGGDDEWEEYEDWEDFEEEGGDGGDYMEYAPTSMAIEAAPAAASAAVPAKPKGLDMVVVQSKLMELVKNVLTDDEELHADMPFMEAGVDSLGSVQLVTDVGKTFQMPLAPSIVFDYPTVRTLTEHLVEESKA